MVHLVELPWEDVSFVHILPSLNLRDLFRLRSVSRENCILVDRYFTTWQTLDLSNYPDIGCAAFGVLVDCCNDLKSVDLRNNYWLKSEHLVLLLEKHPNLGQLDLSGCNNEFLRHSSIDISKWNNLTSLKLKNCKWVNEKFLVDLAQCRKLQEVILAGCYQISDAAIVSFCQFSTGLSHLSFENLTISDQTLNAASLYCRSIKEFCLRGCSRITDAGLLSLRLLPFLTRLEVSGCVLVTERGLAPMRGRVDIDLPPRPICQPQLLSLQV